MAKEIKQVNQDLLKQIINGIDQGEMTEWESTSSKISLSIRNGLVSYIKSHFASKSAIDSNFIEYVNAIKSLLVVYLFGHMIDGHRAKELGENPKEVDNRFTSDKNLIIKGVKNILNHIDEFGYDLTPFISNSDYKRMFKSEGTSEYAPITLTAATVLTTLVYLRRAISREKLFVMEDLIVDDVDLYPEIVKKTYEIMLAIYKFSFAKDRKENFIGWGFTLSYRDTKAASLDDTYAVIDALSKFDDAFNQDDKDKKDEAFIEAINALAKDNNNTFVAQVISSIRKTAINVYDRTKGVFGKGVFFEDIFENGKGPSYNYVLTNYEQIASSSRSSALFNPLYVASITLNGYLDRELVISKLMDDKELLKKLLDTYNKDNIVKFFNEKKVFKGQKAQDIEFNFDIGIKTIMESANGVSKDFANYNWTTAHDSMSALEKFLRMEHPDELSKITVYRDYLKYTRDAIEQVYMMYRDFSDSQRLGVVDTDYVLFNSLDLKITGENEINISKLNKANIAVNSLVPLLTSSKILICNALDKFPQKDIQSLFETIKRTRFKETNNPDEDDNKWLWNEDGINMNATCRVCEAIMYDYFDYYESYEIGVQAVANIKKNAKSYVNSMIDENGKFAFKKDEEATDPFKRVIMDAVAQNVDRIKAIYDQEAKDSLAKHNAEVHKLNSDIKERDETIKALREEIYDIRTKDPTYCLGRDIQEKFKAAFKDYFTELLAMSVLTKLNFKYGDFKTTRMVNKQGEYAYTMNDEGVSKLRENIIKEGKKDIDEASKKYDALGKESEYFVDLISKALSNVFFDDNFNKVKEDESKSIEEKNEQLLSEFKSANNKSGKEN